MVLISDAPPHGREYVNHAALAKLNEEVYEDFFPEGCPCGKTADEILEGMREKNITLFIMKIGQDLDRMIDIF